MEQPITEELDSALLERLSAFVGPLLVELEGKRERRLATQYISGLLGPSARKTVEPMIRAMTGEAAPTRERRMTEMLADGQWNHRSLTLAGAERLLREFPEDVVAYTLDDTAALKKGKDSVGVGNQYAGCLGGLANCQAIVTVGVASEYVSTLIAAQLFLPESWCAPDAMERRSKCRVPPSVKHRTKAQIGLDIVRDIVAWGLPKLPWLADSAYGDNTSFRHALEQAGETYVVGVSLALSVWPIGTRFSDPTRMSAGRPPTRLVAEGGARPVTVAALAASLPATTWNNVLWRHGSRGPQRGRFAAVRVRPARGIRRNNSYGTIHSEDLQPEQWLLMHWPEHEAKPTKAWLSNLPANTDIVTLIALARLRWRIERDHEESKGLLGFDHYEGRTWPGLHHHLALVIVAEEFLALERLRGANGPQAAQAAFPP